MGKKSRATSDGPRFVTSLRDVKDTTCYKDFFETETLSKAKERADEKALEVSRPVLVYDRLLGQIIYRFPEKEDEKPQGKLPLRKKATKEQGCESANQAGTTESASG